MQRANNYEIIIMYIKLWEKSYSIYFLYLLANGGAQYNIQTVDSDLSYNSAIGFLN